MRLSETLRKELYLERLREKLIKLYSYEDAEPDARKRLGDQIDGYFEAALLMKMIDSKVLQNIINEEHFKAFGMTREERKINRQLEGDDVDVDWSRYELPPSARKS